MLSCCNRGIIDMLYQELLDKIVSVSRQIFGQELTGIYLHGSAAMGCFHPDKSDIDLIFVIDNMITDEQKLKFMDEIVNLNKLAPKKGIELSVVRKIYCRKFHYPTPYELHFSNIHLQWFMNDPLDYVDRMKGTDKDLAAHFMIIYHCGITLFGEEIPAVFSEVPKADYIDSIWSDIEGAEKEIVENPIYIILNLCRVIAFVQDELITSKEQGGQWGVRNLELQYQGLILEALACYASEKEMTVQEEEAREFARHMVKKIGGSMMQVIDYYNCDRQEHWLAQIKKSDWAAGQFLYELLSENKFKDAVGEKSKVLMLVNGDELISFCTYAEKDDIQPTNLTPWMGFVYTFPKYRGNHCMEELFLEVERLARAEKVHDVFISTGHTGLYEKYGCEFYQMMEDMSGESARVYRKHID